MQYKLLINLSRLGRGTGSGTETTIGPITDGCENKANDCVKWAKTGSCKGNEWMENCCCKACKEGTIGPITDGCENKANDCVKWAKTGSCKGNEWMENYCCKACKEVPSLHALQQ